MNSAHAIPIGWKHTSLSDSCGLIRDGTHLPPTRVEDGPLLLSVQNMIGGWLRTTPSDTRVSWDFYQQMHRTWCVRPTDVLLAIVGATIGKACRIPDNIPPFTLQRSVAVLRGDDASLLSVFLYWVVSDELFTQQIWQRANQTAQPGLYLAEIQQLRFLLPPPPEQQKIARILTKLDNLIEKTESLIAKYQAIKQGMMHNLFACGVDAHGNHRPPQAEAPDLYKQSELGWIPKEWSVATLGDVAESAIDGPFGSNLKTEHYVTEAGVRVIRLQNIENGSYDDHDRAFISQSHAERLSRHTVFPGDVMVAGMGEETHPVARACLYPMDFPPAINKADCFRVRCIAERMENPFLMLSLNSHYLRPRVERFAQGVTRIRINVRNLKLLPLKVPTLSEQVSISRRFLSVAATVKEMESEKQKLALLKTGLMQDLLTGKVRVKVDEAEEVAV